VPVSARAIARAPAAARASAGAPRRWPWPSGRAGRYEEQERRARDRAAEREVAARRLEGDLERAQKSRDSIYAPLDMFGAPLDARRLADDAREAARSFDEETVLPPPRAPRPAAPPRPQHAGLAPCQPCS